jgi:hypothetical protein
VHLLPGATSSSRPHSSPRLRRGHENALGNVQSDCRNLIHGWPPCYAESLSAFGILMPGAEAIHPIKPNDVEPQAYIAGVLDKLVNL